MVDVDNTQQVDREQVEADFWFSRLRGRLRMEIVWADSPEVAIPYKVVSDRCWSCGDHDYELIIPGGAHFCGS